MKRVHCLGGVVVDALSEGLAEYPVPVRRPQVESRSLRLMPGGGAANAGAALAQMGVAVRIFSKVGRDANGRFVCEALRETGADVSGIRLSARDTTPFTYVGIHPGGERTFIHTPGANRTFAPKDVDAGRLLECDFLLYPDLWALPGLDGAGSAGLLARARRKGVVTLLDECWGFGPRRSVFERTCRHADYLLPSYDDLSAIYPGLSPRGMVARLHRLGVPNVVLKLGKKGCLVSTGKEVVAVPSYAKEIVDTTGAGDCFDAGFVAGLVHGLSAVDSARVGSWAAAECIRHVGGAAGIPRFSVLAARLPK